MTSECKGWEKIKSRNDNLENFAIYKMSLQLWEEFWKNSETMMNDLRGKEIVKQMTRSVYSISANIEEGYGRGFGKDYPQFLGYARGSARETKEAMLNPGFSWAKTLPTKE